MGRLSRCAATADNLRLPVDREFWLANRTSLAVTRRDRGAVTPDDKRTRKVSKRKQKGER